MDNFEGALETFLERWLQQGEEPNRVAQILVLKSADIFLSTEKLRQDNIVSESL